MILHQRFSKRLQTCCLMFLLLLSLCLALTLVEHYSLALAPGLQPPNPHPLEFQQVQALVAGLSETHSNFPTLNVKTKIDRIQTDVESEVWLYRSHRTMGNRTPVY